MPDISDLIEEYKKECKKMIPDDQAELVDNIIELGLKIGASMVINAQQPAQTTIEDDKIDTLDLDGDFKIEEKGAPRPHYDIDDIIVCCIEMREAMMMNEFREGIVQVDNALYIKWGDGDCMPLCYCPSCGKKIERIVKE